MLIKAEQKYVRMSPRKLRLVADAVRGIKDPDELLASLEGIGKRASTPIVKTVKQAVANATNNLGLSAESLKIKELQVTEGPIYKRYNPVARGQVHPIQKKTSHIRVILEAEPQTKQKAQSKRNHKRRLKNE